MISVPWIPRKRRLVRRRSCKQLKRGLLTSSTLGPHLNLPRVTTASGPILYGLTLVWHQRLTSSSSVSLLSVNSANHLVCDLNIPPWKVFTPPAYIQLHSSYFLTCTSAKQLSFDFLHPAQYLSASLKLSLARSLQESETYWTSFPIHGWTKSSPPVSVVQCLTLSITRNSSRSTRRNHGQPKLYLNMIVGFYHS
jgi:hypothetical protein